jgi:hypothetical protein
MSLPSYAYSFNSRRYIRWRIQLTNFPIYIVKTPDISSLLDPNILLNTLFTNTINQCLFFWIYYLLNADAQLFQTQTYCFKTILLINAFYIFLTSTTLIHSLSDLLLFQIWVSHWTTLAVLIFMTLIRNFPYPMHRIIKKTQMTASDIWNMNYQHNKIIIRWLKTCYAMKSLGCSLLRVILCCRLQEFPLLVFGGCLLLEFWAVYSLFRTFSIFPSVHPNRFRHNTTTYIQKYLS